MKKETVIAIFFGVVFGALVAFILLAKNKEFQLAKTKTIAPTEKASKLSKKVIVSLKSLEVSEPADGSIFNTKSINIKGKADKDALIIIQSPVKDIVLKKMLAFLKKCGRVSFFEFFSPADPFLRGLQLFYLRRIVPLVGGMVSGNAQAYRYLNQTIETFPSGEAFYELLEDAGFQIVSSQALTFGSATIYKGDKV